MSEHNIPPKKILVLPHAGLDNPCQYLMVEYLKKQGHSVYMGEPIHPAHKREGYGFLKRTLQVNPDVLYFDWVHDLLLGESKKTTLKKSLRFLFELLIVKYILRKKIVHTLHNIQNHAQHSLKIERFFYRLFLKQCDVVRVYTASTIQKANNYFKMRIFRYVVAPDVPYTFYYDTQLSRSEARKRFNFPENKFVYVFIGHLKPYKGIEELIDVFSMPSFMQDHLIIAGRPGTEVYGAFIRKKITGRENISFIEEYVSKEDLKYVMGAADVVVLPFRNIEHSGSVELAMTFSKAVITLNVPSSMDLLHQQSDLLYSNPAELPYRMLAVKQMDTTGIGKKNGDLAHSVDYTRLNTLFE